MRGKSFTGNHSALICMGIILILQPLFAWAESDMGIAKSLQQALEKQGWKAEHTESGDILYRKPDAVVNKSPVNQGQKTLHLQQMRDVLEQRGWKAELNSDGDLLLWPKQAPKAEAPSTDKTEAETAAAPPMPQQMPNLPGLSYWKIERAADGSLLFHPLPKAELKAPKAAESAPPQSRCETVAMDPDEISLPVNKWREINKLAKAWIAKAGLAKKASIGRIRKVGRIYLFSVVAKNRPHKLMHQLAVRASDGCITQLD